jgi:FAD binding domain
MKISGEIVICLLSAFVNQAGAICKAVPGSSNWPSATDWSSLNSTLNGALMQTTTATLPGAPCHPSEPTYNNDTCSAIQKEWFTWDFHEASPVSTAFNNWNNDTCLPYYLFPCSTGGYPTYVVNATSPGHVQAAVNFAREKNIRLNVKTSGHDFLGRSVAPNSLSIWLYHMHGLQIHDDFKPDCRAHCETTGPAVTFSAGDTHGIVYAAANKSGLMVPVAGGPSVSYGGFVTGGGHSKNNVPRTTQQKARTNFLSHLKA